MKTNKKDKWIEERIATAYECSEILGRMHILQEVYGNEEVTITAKKSTIKGRRSLTIHGPKRLIERLEKLL